MITTQTQSMQLPQSTSRPNAALDDIRTQRIRIAFAIHHVEASLSQAAPGRESAWKNEVNLALDSLIAAMSESIEFASQKNVVVEQINSEKPTLTNLMTDLQVEFDRLLDQLKSVQDQIENCEYEQQFWFADLRQRISWLLAGIRQQHARESDLVFEALNLNIGV